MMASFQKQKPVRFLSNRASRCSVHPKYASLLRISGALRLGIFEQPKENHFFSNLID